MENLTHTLFGATLYRCGFERYVPRTLPLWLIGANLPDLDIVTRFFGPSVYLCHHRGLSHSALGLVVSALVMASVWWLLERLVSIQPEGARSAWPRLFVASLVVLISHPLLDALNNYGVRPLLPFDNRWFYGDLVFIVDPWIWLMLGGALALQGERRARRGALWLVLSVLTALVIAYVEFMPLTAKLLWYALLSLLVVCYRARRALAGAARAALALMALYIASLALLQHYALVAAERYLRAQAAEPPTRFSVSPSLANPFRWEVFAESPDYFYYGAVRIVRRPGAERPLAHVAVARNHPAVARAFLTAEGRAMRAFSRYLIIQVEPRPAATLVVLSDGRYARERRAGFSVVKVTVPNS